MGIVAWVCIIAFVLLNAELFWNWWRRRRR
jgi:hypothetical protein